MAIATTQHVQKLFRQGTTGETIDEIHWHRKK